MRRFIAAGLFAVLVGAPGVTIAQPSNSLGACLVVTLRDGAALPADLDAFCRSAPPVTYPNGKTFEELYSWTPEVLAFAFDEAERGLSGVVTGVTGSRAAHLVLVPGVLANAMVRVSANSVDILMTSALVDFVEATSAGVSADFLRGRPDQVVALGYSGWLQSMREAAGKRSPSGSLSVPYPGPAASPLQWNVTYIRTPAQSIYELLFGHELSHLQLGVPSGGKTDAEILSREVQMDRNAFRATGPTSPHRDAMVMKGNLVPPYIIAFLVAMRFYENLRGDQLREVFKTAGAPPTFQQMFPARDWAQRATELIADWERMCRAGAGGTVCRAGWEQGVDYSRSLVALPPPERSR
jgi:hypothetical protein